MDRVHRDKRDNVVSIIKIMLQICFITQNLRLCLCHVNQAWESVYFKSLGGGV